MGLGDVARMPFDMANDAFFPDPSKKAGKTLDQIPGQTNQYGQPFFETGKNQLPGLDAIYKQLMTNPQAVMDMLSKGYKQSPGYANRLGAGEQAITNSAAAGGMLGTGEHQTNAGKFAENFASDDYNKFMEQIMSLFSGGVGGSQHLADQGQQAGSDMAKRIQEYLTNKATMEYTGQDSRNKNTASMMGMIAKAFGGGGGM
jgi:hypothetical protein